MMIAHSPPALSLPLRTPQATPRPPLVPPATVDPRFTVDGALELEQHLARTCEKIAAGVRGLIPPRKLEALVLGGGYGRGEGGVLATAAGERPYNDLEFYVFVRGNRHLNERRFGRALHVLGEILTPQAGVEVEFKISSRRELERSAVTMFSYDLVMGHRWLIGDDRLLARCGHHRDAERIPLAEATRLLMNRCSGLLFAAEKLQRREFTAADADFTARNIAKAELALGDAVLVTKGTYHWSVRERERRLAELPSSELKPWLGRVREHHAAGTQFKLRPQRSAASREELAARHAAVTARALDVWLWLEQQRMCAPLPSPRDYALSHLTKCRDQSRGRNVLVNARTLGPRAIVQADATRHPRERILNTLALLLWDRATLGSPELLRFVQRELQTTAVDFTALVAAYRTLWAKVN